MSDATELYLANRQRLIDGHAYDPDQERDACGVGLVCAIDGKPRREVVELAIKALKAVWHRGAIDADGKTGDGAGVLVSVPQDFFAEQVRRLAASGLPVDPCEQWVRPRAGLGRTGRVRGAGLGRLGGHRSTSQAPAVRECRSITSGGAESSLEGGPLRESRPNDSRRPAAWPAQV